MSLQAVSRSGLVFLIASLGSCLVGYVAFGAEIFNPQLSLFQFVTSGAIGGSLASTLVLGLRKATWAMAGIALVVFLAVMRPSTGALVLRDLIYVPTLLASVWLAWVVSSKLAFARIGQVLAWGVVFALCHLAMFGILTIANGAPFYSKVAYASVQIGGLVGVGVGIGVLFAGGQPGATRYAAR